MGGVTPAEWQSKMNPKDFGHGAWWINASGGCIPPLSLPLTPGSPAPYSFFAPAGVPHAALALTVNSAVWSVIV